MERRGSEDARGARKGVRREQGDEGIALEKGGGQSMGGRRGCGMGQE